MVWPRFSLFSVGGILIELIWRVEEGRSIREFVLGERPVGFLLVKDDWQKMLRLVCCGLRAPNNGGWHCWGFLCGLKK